MAVLMDSCNVMKGNKSGFETRLRTEKTPHLLDVDDDVCHHIHNSSKAFCKPFNHLAEALFLDIFNDLKWSPDLRESMEEICLMLGVKFTMPQRYVSHRWLSVNDVTMNTHRMFDALAIFFTIHGSLPWALTKLNIYLLWWKFIIDSKFQRNPGSGLMIS